MNSSQDETQNKLKPLEEYIKDLKSRNMKLSQFVPGIDKNFGQVSSYDDLYKKLIEESYYICNELLNKKKQGIVCNTDKETEQKNVNKALTFNSTENINKRKIEENTEDYLSPINKQEEKSTLFTPTNLKIKSSLNKKACPNQDIIFLIRNAKEVEKTLEEQEKLDKEELRGVIESYEQKFRERLKEIENYELHLIETKEELKSRTEEVKALVRQYEKKAKNLEDRDGYTCTLQSVADTKSDEHRNEFYQEKFRISKEQSKGAELEPAVANKINSLLIYDKLEDADSLWKTHSYLNCQSLSSNKSFEMLRYLLKAKNRDIEELKRQLKAFETNSPETRMKDNEIVELFAELEHTKSQLREFKITNRKHTSNQKKLENIIKENSLLYKENVRLKTLMEQKSFQNNKSNYYNY